MLVIVGVGVSWGRGGEGDKDKVPRVMLVAWHEEREGDYRFELRDLIRGKNESDYSLSCGGKW